MTTVLRDTPISAASSRDDGNSDPEGKRPARIARCKRSISCFCSGAGFAPPLAAGTADVACTSGPMISIMAAGPTEWLYRGSFEHTTFAVSFSTSMVLHALYEQEESRHGSQTQCLRPAHRRTGPGLERRPAARPRTADGPLLPD